MNPLSYSIELVPRQRLLKEASTLFRQQAAKLLPWMQWLRNVADRLIYVAILEKRTSFSCLTALTFVEAMMTALLTVLPSYLRMGSAKCVLCSWLADLLRQLAVQIWSVDADPAAVNHRLSATVLRRFTVHIFSQLAFQEKLSICLCSTKDFLVSTQ